MCFLFLVILTYQIHYNTFKDARIVRPDESGRTILHSEFYFITDTQLLRDMTRSTRRILRNAFDTK